jgi:hypothetical protein
VVAQAQASSARPAKIGFHLVIAGLLPRPRGALKAPAHSLAASTLS